jgi:isocitrate lyase
MALSRRLIVWQSALVDDQDATQKRQRPQLEFTSLERHHPFLHACRRRPAERHDPHRTHLGSYGRRKILEAVACRALHCRTGRAHRQPGCRDGAGRAKAIYLSGWQVAADVNLGGQMYPDQSLYPVNSVPAVVRSINNALLRADQISHSEGRPHFDWMLPIVAMPRRDSAATSTLSS